MVPLLAGVFFAWPGAHWASIAGFSAVVVDKGGAYRTRATAMVAVTLGCTLAVVASGGSGATWSAALVMLVFATSGGMLRVLGPEMSSVGTSSAVMLTLAIDASLSPWDAISRAPYVVAGGAWAMALSLLFWPVRVHRPGRIAVARCFDDLALHTRAMASLLGRSDTAAWHTLLQNHRLLRENVEVARGVLSAIRRGNRGESGRGGRLLTLFSTADQIFAALVGLADTIDEEPKDRQPILIAKLNETGARLAQMASDIRNEEQILTPSVADDPHDIDPECRSEVIFARIGRWLDLARDVVVTLHDDAPLRAVDPALADASGAELSHRVSPFAELRAALSADSAIARHAARLGISSAIAVIVTRALHLHRGYWITLTVLIVLQPYTPETVKKGLQRIAGTVAGGILASLVVYFIRDEYALLVLASLLAAASVAVLQLNYALYAFFLTPTFVLLAEVSAGDFQLAKLRTLDTLIGGAIAFVCARALWPTSEERRFPGEMATALRAGCELLESSVDVPMRTARFDGARRQFGIAINNAEASFQRLLAEAGSAPVAMEPRMTLLLFTRRFAGSCIRAATLGTSRRETRFVTTMETLLEDLASSIERGNPPSPLPPRESFPPGDRDLERIALQLRVLHDAALRLSSSISAEEAPSTRD